MSLMIDLFSMIRIKKLQSHAEHRPARFIEGHRALYNFKHAPGSNDDVITIHVRAFNPSIDHVVLCYMIQERENLTWMRSCTLSASREAEAVTISEDDCEHIFRPILQVLGFSETDTFAQQDDINPSVWHFIEYLVWPPFGSVRKCK